MAFNRVANDVTVGTSLSSRSPDRAEVFGVVARVCYGLFMSSQLSFYPIDERIFVGSFPQSGECIAYLRDELEVTGVLNLQSDEDLYARAVNWSALWREYVGRGMEIVRVPILDLVRKDLGRHLDEAVTSLHGLLDRHEKVYLHCNVGLNRSPTVAIAYFTLHHGLSLEDATRKVRGQRQCMPYPEVVERWLKRR